MLFVKAKSHKYYKKIKLKGKDRYFYNKKEYAEYLDKKKKTVKKKVVKKTIAKKKIVIKEKKDVKTIPKKKTTKRPASRVKSISRGNARNGQPYSADGIILSRSQYYKSPKNEILSGNVKKILKPHQAEFVNLAMEKLNDSDAVFNFDGTGAGKTMQEIVLADNYLKKSKKPILIVTKDKRIIGDAFVKDAKMLKIDINQIEKESEMSGNKIYITTYSRLSKHFKTAKLGMVIYDESHAMKNFASGQSKAGRDIMDRADKTACFTATPIDAPHHLVYVCKAIGADFNKVMEHLGYSFVQKRNRMGVIVSEYWKRQQGVSIESVVMKIEKIFDDMTKKGAGFKREISLKGFTQDKINVKMTAEHQATINNAIENYWEIEQTNPRMKGGALLELRRLNEEAKIDATIQKVKADLKAGKQPVLFATRVNDTIASQTTGEDQYSVGSLQEIARRLKIDKIDVAEVYNSNPQAVADIKKFQEGKIKVILTTPQSGGTGLSLDDTKGNAPRSAIIMTPPFNAMNYIQMIGRIKRLKTKSPATATIMLTDNMIDEWNMGIITSKLSVLGASVKGDYGKIDLDNIFHSDFMPTSEVREKIFEKYRPKKTPIIVQTSNQAMEYAKKNKSVIGATAGHPSELIKLIAKFQGGTASLNNLIPNVIIDFGRRHKGDTMKDIQRTNPNYLTWLAEKIFKMDISKFDPTKIKIVDESEIKKSIDFNGKIKYILIKRKAKKIMLNSINKRK